VEEIEAASACVTIITYKHFLAHAADAAYVLGLEKLCVLAQALRDEKKVTTDQVMEAVKE
jgi:hypothetical protein